VNKRASSMKFVRRLLIVNRYSALLFLLLLVLRGICATVIV